MRSQFFSAKPSLKICGVTTKEDALSLVEMGVDALGFNFWPKSKRYCSPDAVEKIAPPLSGKILRVGVFVNNARDLAQELFQKDLIDVIQLHGDESIDEVEHFLSLNIPVIRALSALNLPQNPLPQSNFALLIDTPAGQDYGGTGKTFDWSLAQDFSLSHPETPIILAGGITPENAERALLETHPIALDVASGAEISPGIKDLKKVRSLMEIVSQ